MWVLYAWLYSRCSLTLLAQQVRVEAQVVDAEVETALPGHPALPVAAGVIVHQLLLVWHPEHPPKLSGGFLELVGVVVLLVVMIFVVFRNDALKR